MRFHVRMDEAILHDLDPDVRAELVTALTRHPSAIDHPSGG